MIKEISFEEAEALWLIGADVYYCVWSLPGYAEDCSCGHRGSAGKLPFCFNSVAGNPHTVERNADKLRYFLWHKDDQ